mmetsp:Transcript_9776/g.24895  ORF Transcript_9776/g.24895 Transcript_9776/m.24895 type:complete len:217 (+) Transcript_9776:156-806(+)
MNVCRGRTIKWQSSTLGLLSTASSPVPGPIPQGDMELAVHAAGHGSGGDRGTFRRQQERVARPRHGGPPGPHGTRRDARDRVHKEGARRRGGGRRCARGSSRSRRTRRRHQVCRTLVDVLAGEEPAVRRDRGRAVGYVRGDGRPGAARVAADANAGARGVPRGAGRQARLPRPRLQALPPCAAVPGVGSRGHLRTRRADATKPTRCEAEGSGRRAR